MKQPREFWIKGHIAISSEPSEEWGKCVHVREVDPAYDAAVAGLVETLNDTLNYLHWHADDLTGDDLIGDERKTKSYDKKLKNISEALATWERVNEGK